MAHPKRAKSGNEAQRTSPTPAAPMAPSPVGTDRPAGAGPGRGTHPDAEASLEFEDLARDAAERAPRASDLPADRAAKALRKAKRLI